MILKDLQTAYFLMNIDVSFKKCLQRKDFAETNEKTTRRVGENVCKRWDQQWISFQNLQTAHAAQYPKNKQPNQKMGRRPK